MVCKTSKILISIGIYGLVGLGMAIGIKQSHHESDVPVVEERIDRVPMASIEPELVEVEQISGSVAHLGDFRGFTDKSGTMFHPYNFIPLTAEIQSDIKQICDREDIDFDLMMAIAKVESNWRPDAVGTDGHDRGLFQVRDFWNDKAIEMGLTNWQTDAVENCEIAIFILKRCLYNNNGDLDKALTMYNTGNIIPNDYPSRVYTAKSLIEEAKNEN